MNTRAIDLQIKEFDAVRILAERYRAITMTAVVDDDYPEVRHRYEASIRDLMLALHDNGRATQYENRQETSPATKENRRAGGEGAEGNAQAALPTEEEGRAQITERAQRAGFVAQDWTRYIPMMQQTVLFGIVRGPDGVPKYHPVKPILRWYRRCLLLSALDGEVIDNPWDPRGGSFTGPSIAHPTPAQMHNTPAWWLDMDGELSKFMQTMDQMPIHFWLHMLHAVEIMGVHHSDPHIRSWWTYVYERMTHAMHLYPEKPHQLNRRLGDTREGWLERSDPAITK